MLLSAQKYVLFLVVEIMNRTVSKKHVPNDVISIG